jgi:hypothetical protein
MHFLHIKLRSIIYLRLIALPPPKMFDFISSAFTAVPCFVLGCMTLGCGGALVPDLPGVPV